MPKVSVCIPTYNRAAYLREAVASVLSQTGVDFEIVLSDNASTDGTEETARSFGDPRVRYFRNPQNLGSYENLLCCTKLASGELIAWLFDDDVMLPGTLARKVALLESNPAAGLVHTNFTSVHPDGRELDVQTPPVYPSDRMLPSAVAFRDMIVSDNLVAYSTVLVRRACYDRLGFNARLGYTGDFEMWMRIALHYDVGYLLESSVRLRLHPGQDSQNFMGLSGLDDLFEAKRMILDNYADRISGRRLLRARAALRYGQRAVRLGARLAWSGRGREARECFAFAAGLPLR